MRMTLPRPLGQLHPIAAWRLLWVGPAFLARCLFCALIFCGWGGFEGRRAWRATK